MKLLNGTRLRLFLILSLVSLFSLSLITPAIIYADGDDSGGLTLDLAYTHEGIVGIYGRNNGDKTGIGLDAGDVNGDGFDDIVVGARWCDDGAASDAGVVYVFFGSPVMFQCGAVDLVNPRSRVLEIVGASGGDNLGESVSAGAWKRARCCMSGD